MPTYSRYKFGDIVINHSAGDINPHKRGIVVRKGRMKAGKYSYVNWIECTDGKGDFWRYAGPEDQLELVGSALNTGEGR